MVVDSGTGYKSKRGTDNRQLPTQGCHIRSLLPATTNEDKSISLIDNFAVLQPSGKFLIRIALHGYSAHQPGNEILSIKSTLASAIGKCG